MRRPSHHLATLRRMISRDTPTLAENSPPKWRRGSNEPFEGAEMTKRMSRPVRRVKVGAGTPPVRIREGWLALVHGVDELPEKNGKTRLRYSAGVIVHSASHLDQVLLSSFQRSAVLC